MGNVDIQTKEYMSDPERFADALNFAIYGGRHVIRKEKLSPMDTTEVVMPFGIDGIDYKQRHRDVLKLWKAMRDDHAIYAILGIENQTDVHYAMPVRNMLYDAISYSAQITKKRRRKKGTEDGEYLSEFRKSDTLVPVVTVVIHFGTDKWDGSMSVHEMLDDCDEELLALVPDYKINLIDPSEIPDGEFSQFSTGLGLVLRYIKYAKNKEGLTRVVGEDKRYENVDRESANLINMITDSELQFETGKGEVNMCQAIKEMRKESYEQGERAAERRMAEGIREMRRESYEQGERAAERRIAEGIREMRKESYEEGELKGQLMVYATLIADGLISQELAAERLGLSVDELKEKIDALG